MCYEYDDVFEWARLTEQLRGEKKLADDLAKQSGTPTPIPAEPEKGVKEQQPVPA
jgi:hypothetical protein